MKLTLHEIAKVVGLKRCHSLKMLPLTRLSLIAVRLQRETLLPLKGARDGHDFHPNCLL